MGSLQTARFSTVLILNATHRRSPHVRCPILGRAYAAGPPLECVVKRLGMGVPEQKSDLANGKLRVQEVRLREIVTYAVENLAVGGPLCVEPPPEGGDA